MIRWQENTQGSISLLDNWPDSGMLFSGHIDSHGTLTGLTADISHCSPVQQEHMRSESQLAMHALNSDFCSLLWTTKYRFPKAKTRIHSPMHSIHSSRQASFYEDITELVFIIVGNFGDGVVEIVGNGVQHLCLLHSILPSLVKPACVAGKFPSSE